MDAVAQSAQAILDNGSAVVSDTVQGVKDEINYCKQVLMLLCLLGLMQCIYGILTILRPLTDGLAVFLFGRSNVASAPASAATGTNPSPNPLPNSVAPKEKEAVRSTDETPELYLAQCMANLPHLVAWGFGWGLSNIMEWFIVQEERTRVWILWIKRSKPTLILRIVVFGAILCYGLSTVDEISPLPPLKEIKANTGDFNCNLTQVAVPLQIEVDCTPLIQTTRPLNDAELEKKIEGEQVREQSDGFGTAKVQKTQRDPREEAQFRANNTKCVQQWEKAEAENDANKTAYQQNVEERTDKCNEQKREWNEAMTVPTYTDSDISDGLTSLWHPWGVKYGWNAWHIVDVLDNVLLVCTMETDADRNNYARLLLIYQLQQAVLYLVTFRYSATLVREIVTESPFVSDKYKKNFKAQHPMWFAGSFGELWWLLVTIFLAINVFRHWGKPFVSPREVQEDQNGSEDQATPEDPTWKDKSEEVRQLSNPQNPSIENPAPPGDATSIHGHHERITDTHKASNPSYANKVGNRAQKDLTSLPVTPYVDPSPTVSEPRAQPPEQGSQREPVHEVVEPQDTEWEVEKLCGVREGANGEWEYLVKWKGYRNCTWVTTSDLDHCAEAITEYWTDNKTPVSKRQRSDATTTNKRPRLAAVGASLRRSGTPIGNFDPDKKGKKRGRT